MKRRQYDRFRKGDNFTEHAYYTISLKCKCIDYVDQVKKLAWSGIRRLVSAQSRRGKEISIALLVQSLDPAYGESERYNSDIICTIIQAEWYYSHLYLYLHM